MALFLVTLLGLTSKFSYSMPICEGLLEHGDISRHAQNLEVDDSVLDLCSPKPAGKSDKKCVLDALNEIVSAHGETLGLSVKEGRLYGAMDKGLVAKVVAQAMRLHKINFFIDDKACDDEKAEAFAKGNDIYMRSRFLLNPSLKLLLHEIRHTTSFRKRQFARLMFVYPNHSEGMHAFLWGSYKQKYRMDELEARVIESTLEPSKIEEARKFADHEYELMTQAKENLVGGGPIEFKKMDEKSNPVLLIHLQSSILAFEGVLNNFSTEAEKRTYLTGLVEERLEQIDALGSRLAEK